MRAVLIASLLLLINVLVTHARTKAEYVTEEAVLLLSFPNSTNNRLDTLLLNSTYTYFGTIVSSEHAQFSAAITGTVITFSFIHLHSTSLHKQNYREIPIV